MLIISDLLPKDYKEKLEKVIPKNEILYFNADNDVTSDESVYNSILHHPDIYFFMADKKTIIHSPNISPTLIEKLRDKGMTLLAGDKYPSGKYPKTILYNSVRIGDLVFCNKIHTDKRILGYIKEENLQQINVNQGYARCSVMVIDEGAIITSDCGIKTIAQKKKIRVFYIDPSEIILPGEKNGFIGGATGKVSDDEILFFGDPNLHKNHENAMEFIKKKGIKVTILSDLPLIDIGGAVLI